MEKTEDSQQMGGYGSGQWRSYGARRAVEDGLSLNIGYLQRERFISPDMYFRSGRLNWKNPSTGEIFASISYKFWGESSGMQLELSYKVNGEAVELSIPLMSTPAYFGGVRLWLTCPLCSSGRKLSKLYIPPGSRRFGCRECHNLTYQSSKESRKFDGLYRLLAGDSGLSPEQVKRALRDM